MSAIWSRVDGRLPNEQRSQVLVSHQFDTDIRELGEEECSSFLQCSNLAMPSATALVLSSDVRISYSQGKTSLIVALSGPTTSKHEATYEKAEVVFRLQSRVGVLALQPLFAVGSAPEKRRFFEARHHQLHETYASVLLPLLQTAAESVLCLEQFPRCVIMIDVLVEEEDGGLFAAVLNGVMCAILKAGLPCRTSFAAVTVAVLTAMKKKTSVDNARPEAADRGVNTKSLLLERQKRKRTEEEMEPKKEIRSGPSDGSSGSSDSVRSVARDGWSMKGVLDGSAPEGSLCYFIDPSSLEETLSGCPIQSSESDCSLFSRASAGGSSSGNVTENVHAAALATTERGQLLKMQQECRTIAVGTFVMSYRPGAAAGVGHPTMASHVQSGPGMSRVPYQGSLKPEEWLHMEHIANVSATRVFDFYRMLDDPLE